MLVKDFKYIIKRIIIGVGIALIIMLIKGGLVLNVHAQSGSLSSIVVYRGYTNGNYSDANNVRNQQLYGNLPFTIFAPYQDRTVWGIRLLADFSNIGAFNGSAYQNVLDVYFRFDQTGANDYWNNSINASAIYVSNLNTTSNVSCALSSQTSSSRTYHCTGGFNNYEYPTTVNFVVGDPNNYTAQSQWVSYINQYTSIDIGAITYSTTTAQSPDSANISDIKNGVNDINNNIDDINNSINDSDTDQVQQDSDTAFLNFSLNTHGLTRVITAPLRLISALFGGTCSTLSFPLPFVNQNVNLPCMSTIYQQHFGNFLTLYRLITDGIIGYWVAIKVFKKCKDFLDPTNDKIEVFNL